MSLKPLDDWGKYLPSKTTFSPKNNKSHEIFSTDIYIGENLEFIFIFPWCFALSHEIYTKYKKSRKNATLCNYLIKFIPNYTISALESKLNKEKIPGICHSIPETFVPSQNSFVPFHRIFLCRSRSKVFLKDELNESFRFSTK